MSEKYICPECGDEFKSSQALGSHITYQHRRKDDQFEKEIAKVRSFIEDNPGSKEYLERILQVEDEMQRHFDEIGVKTFLGWERQEVAVPRQELEPMLLGEIIRLQYKSSKYTNYALVNREATREALRQLEEEIGTRPEKVSLPDDFLDIVEGHDTLKQVIRASLESDIPIPVLMVGPPATAKSLVLLEIKNALPQLSRYILGGTTSKAGLVDFLIVHRPHTLLLDELDKMALDDQTALLSLLEDGIVTRMKYGKRDTVQLMTWVFAGANTTEPLTEGLLSRFYIQYLEPYDKEAFKRVTIAVLTRREGIPDDIAEYIANRVSEFSNDIRDPRKVARLARATGFDREKLEVFIQGLAKGLRVGGQYVRKPGY